MDKYLNDYLELIEQGVCPDCLSELINENGCKRCPNCGWSACNN